MTNNTLPVFFISHGSPMNAIEDNIFTQDWKTLHRGTEKPNAIVVFSAHWHVPGIRITTAKPLTTVHDFSGFPPTLHQQQYPADTALNIAEKITSMLQTHGHEVSNDRDWGLDHGSWSVLKHLYPRADIPVIQVSMDNRKTDIKWHYDLARQLKPLRQQGVLFIGSGGIVHNIQKWMMSRPGDAIDWAREFDDTIAAAINHKDIETLYQYQQLPYARDAAPTVEHYLPLIYCMGLSDDDDEITHSAFSSDDRRDLSLCCSRSLRFSKLIG